MKYATSILFFCFSIISFTAQAATLVVEDGQLKGADGIVFEGYSASVRFVEGTCAERFDGCDDPADLVFELLTGDITAAKDLAVLANQALLAQVFDANPLYDHNVGLTFGCTEGNTRLIRCSPLTPYFLSTDTTVLTSSLTNRDDRTGALDQVAFGQGYNITDDSTFPSVPGRTDRVVYASWDLTPAAVPVPAAAPLFLTAMLFLGLWQRRRSA